jgi:hypothetical protein
MAASNGDITILMIDIDEVVLPFDRIKYEHQAKEIVEFFGYKIIGVAYKFSTHKGIHIHVWVAPEVEPTRIPLLQYLLGSDFKRECINHFRLREGVDINVLFSGKQRIRYANGKTMNCDYMCKGLIEEIRLAERLGIKRLQI